MSAKPSRLFFKTETMPRFQEALIIPTLFFEHFVQNLATYQFCKNIKFLNLGVSIALAALVQWRLLALCSAQSAISRIGQALPSTATGQVAAVAAAAGKLKVKTFGKAAFILREEKHTLIISCGILRRDQSVGFCPPVRKFSNFLSPSHLSSSLRF